MLKRFLPAAIVLLGLLVVGLGIASATLWKPLPIVRAVATPADAGNVVITAPGVLDLVSSEVTVRASAPGSRVVLVIGRDSDVAAWAAASPHLLVTGLSSWTQLATDSAAASVPQASASASAGDTASPTASADSTASADPTPTAAADGGGASAAATAGSATTGGIAPDPSGSDMWLVQANGKDSATLTWASRPGRWSALAVSVGTSPTAPELELSWPHPVTTPWFAPAMAVGGALLLLGLGLLALMGAQTRSPELVEAWRGGMRVPAGIGAEQADALASASAPAAGLTRREMRERERARDEAPAVASPGPFARLRASVVTWALRFLPPAAERVAVPTAAPATPTPTPTPTPPRPATAPTPGAAVPAGWSRVPPQTREPNPSGWTPGAPAAQEAAPQRREPIPTGWSQTAPPVKQSLPTGWSPTAPPVQQGASHHPQQPGSHVQQPAPQGQQSAPTSGRRAAQFGLHAAGRPAMPAPPPTAPRRGAPPPDSPAIPLPPVPVAPVPGAAAHDPQAAGSTRADAWRRAWGFPGIAEGTDNATEDITDTEEGR